MIELYIFTAGLLTGAIPFWLRDRFISNRPKWVTLNRDKPLTGDERISILIAAQRLVGCQPDMTRERQHSLGNALFTILETRQDAE